MQHYAECRKKSEKKVKKVVDNYFSICYINGAVCKKKVSNKAKNKGFDGHKKGFKKQIIFKKVENWKLRKIMYKLFIKNVKKLLTLK